MMSTAYKFAEAERNEWQCKMEWSLWRNAETHLATSHRLLGEQAHTCDPTDRPAQGRGGTDHCSSRLDSCSLTALTSYMGNTIQALTDLVIVFLVFLSSMIVCHVQANTWCAPAELNGQLKEVFNYFMHFSTTVIFMWESGCYNFFNFILF